MRTFFYKKRHFTLFSCLIGLIQLCLLTKLALAAKVKTLPLLKLLGHWEAYIEMSKFLADSLVKFENVSCHTIIWDKEMSTVLDYLDLCPPGQKDSCTSKYTINFEGGNSTEEFSAALRAGYREQCGAYIILLSNSNLTINLLHYGDDLRMINTRGRFLIWYGDLDKDFETDDIWKKLPNVILFHAKLKRKNRKRLSFSLMAVKWPVVPNSTETSRLIGFWRNGAFVNTMVTYGGAWYRDKTTDLRNVTLQILTVEHPPSVIKFSSLDGYVEYAGTEIEVIKELSIIMNFNFELVDADPITKWGGQIMDNSTRHFYGAVARLIYGEADMAIGSFLILKHYLDYLDMSVPLDVACTSFLTPNPLPRPRYLALILPFHYHLWILMLSICFIFAPLGFYALARLPLHTAEYRIFSRPSQTVFTSLSIMSQVALHLWPRFWSIRMLIVWYWLFCLLLTLAYRGAMVSFLTIPLFEQPIDTTNDLAASNLRIGGWGIDLYNLFTQHGTLDDDKTKTYLSKKYEIIDDLNHGISMVAEGKFALYENIRYLKFIRMTRNLTKVGSPSMRLMKQCVLPVHLGIAYQKNSPIVPTINRHIRRFQESGLMKRWSQRLILKTKQYYRETLAASSDHDAADFEDGSSDEDEKEEDEAAANSKQRKQRVLSIKDLQGAIYFILFGILLSIGAFIGEIAVAHWKHAHRIVNVELKRIIMKKSKTIKIGRKIIDPRFQLIGEDLLTLHNKRKKKLRRASQMKKFKRFQKDKLLFPYLE